MITLLIGLVVLALIAVVAFWILSQMGLPAPVDLIARVVVGLVLLLMLLGYVHGDFGSLQTLRLPR